MTMPNKSSGILRFVRPKQLADTLRSYTLHVNGRTVGALPRSGELDVEVPAGRATIEAKIDWCGSDPLSIEVKAGQITKVEVSNRLGPLLSIWGITFGMNTYLQLTPVSS